MGAKKSITYTKNVTIKEAGNTLLPQESPIPAINIPGEDLSK